MSKRSFEGLPPVLSSHHFLFQVPAVVSENVYFSSVLEALFPNVNILVKVVILLLTQISTVLWKIIKVWLQKALFDIRSPSWRKLFRSCSISFSYFALQGSTRKFVIFDFSDSKADRSVTLSSLSYIGSFMSCLFWGSSNIPAVSFSTLIRDIVSRRKISPLPSQTIDFTKFLITPNFICKVWSNILFDLTRGWVWTLYEPGFNPCLDGFARLT